jgi:hypothetical protein
LALDQPVLAETAVFPEPGTHGGTAPIAQD